MRRVRIIDNTSRLPVGREGDAEYIGWDGHQHYVLVHFGPNDASFAAIDEIEDVR